MKRISLFLLFIIFFSACTSVRPTRVPNPTATQAVEDTSEPIHWATLAPASAYQPTPTKPPASLRYPPIGRIAFQSSRDGNEEIYVINADGTFMSRLTNNPAVDVFPSWSPVGDRLAFTSDRGGNPDIYIMDANGKNLKQITKDSSDDALPAWSPDGKQMAYVSNRDGDDEIYLMNVDGSGVKQLTNNSSRDMFPAWSTYGRQIAFTSDRDVNFEIYVMNDDGSNLMRLTEDPAADSNPAWSPDSKKIAFISNRDGFSNIYIMDADGRNVVQLTHQRATLEKPSWSPDGRLIAFASNQEGNRDIYLMGADGYGLFKLTSGSQENFYPAWSSTQENLASSLVSPTLPPQLSCNVSLDLNYGYSENSPIKLGYDPRDQGVNEHSCLTWLTGPQGQQLQTELLDVLHVGDTNICKVAVSYEGQKEPAVLYFDLFNFSQPKAPIGFKCGSEEEYSKAISSALKIKMK